MKVGERVEKKDDRTGVFVDIHNRATELEKNPIEPNPFIEWFKKSGSLIISIFIPFIGIPLFVIWRDERKTYAKYPLIGMLIGFSTYIVAAIQMIVALLRELF